jgi:CheY-like chemotaxis protein
MAKLRILVVDDSVEIRWLVRMALEEDYEVLEAGTCDQAIALIRAERPRRILLDIMMPGRLDGLQVLEMMKSDPELRDIPVVLVSARGQLRDYEGLRLGADDYFIKPFNPFRLLEFARGRLGSESPS